MTELLPIEFEFCMGTDGQRWQACRYDFTTEQLDISELLDVPVIRLKLLRGCRCLEEVTAGNGCAL